MATGLSALSETSIQKKFENLTGAQDSIQSVSLWIIHHKSESKQLVNIWLKVLRHAAVSQKLLLFYLCNDVVQNCKRKQAPVFVESFKSVLLEGLQIVREPSIKPKVLRILNIWEERNVYKSVFISQLKAILDGKDASEVVPKTYKATKKEPKSDEESKEKAKSKEKMPVTKVNNAQLLAEFKPQTLIHKVTVFRKMELQNELKQKHLTKVPFDETSLETFKQLKDKSQGKEFTNNFEDAVSKLEATVRYLEQDVNDRGEVIDLAETSEIFYDEQYKEAKIVANAYRNFGTRINNMKKKLDDIKNKFPTTPSPVPSPILDAPSPEPTPPPSDPNDYTDLLDMDIDSDEEKKRRKAKNDPRADHVRQSLAVLTNNYTPSITTVASTITMIDQSRKSESGSTTPKVRTLKDTEKSHHKSHSRIRSVVSVVTPSEKEKQKIQEPSKRSHSQSKRESVEDNDEEGCSTPVQDEARVEPPQPPVQKENPIDFLTKLLSKTNSSVPGTGASFLQNLSLLTSTVKSQFEQNKLTKDSPENNDEVSPPNVQIIDEAPSWSAWNTNTSSPESTSPVVQMPTIPRYSSGVAVAPVNHIVPHHQPMHVNLSTQHMPSGQTPRMVPHPNQGMPVPIQSMMIQDADNNVSVSGTMPVRSPLHPPGPPPGISQGMPLSNRPQYLPQHQGHHMVQSGEHGPVLPPHIMQRGHSQPPLPGMYTVQQHPGHLSPGTMMPGPSAQLTSPKSSNQSPEVLLPSPVVSIEGFNYNPIPSLMQMAAPPPPPPLRPRHSMLEEDSGLDDILNQIVTGEGFQQTSQGEKENRPGENRGDIDCIMMDQFPSMTDGLLNLPRNTTSSFLSTTPGRSILRNSNSVLPIATSHPSSSGAVVIPLGHACIAASDSNQGMDSQPQFIQALRSVERDPTEDIEDFTEKLNTDVINEQNNIGHLFSRNPIRPNLTCLTPQDDEINKIENIKSISTIGNHIDDEPRPIMTLGASLRIPSVEDEPLEPPVEPVEHSHAYGHNKQEHNFEPHYEPLPPRNPHFHPAHDPYYDRPGDPYARYPPERFQRFPRPQDPYFYRRDPYGPPPPKRPYPPDNHRGRPFYRY